MKTQSGFTLIEILVAIAVFVLLATLAIPSLDTFMQGNRLTSATNQLVASLNLARSEAVKRTSSVTSCITDSAMTACNGASTNWSDGWLLFVDNNNDAVLDAGETIINAARGVAGGTTIQSNQFANTITYRGDGSANTTGSFKVCGEDQNTLRAKGINIAGTGNISLAKDTDATPNDLVNIYTTGSTWGDIVCP